MPADTTLPVDTDTKSSPKAGVVLPPNSAFSMMVFKMIRPNMPVKDWPVGEAVTGVFTPLSTGRTLVAVFDNLRGAAKKYAEYTVYENGLELILASPAALAAIGVLKAKRWRDACLYSVLPLLFAIPLVGGIAVTYTNIVALITVADVVLLIAMQIWLGKAQKILSESGFIAQIPTPTMRIKVGQKAN